MKGVGYAGRRGQVVHRRQIHAEAENTYMHGQTRTRIQCEAAGAGAARSSNRRLYSEEEVSVCVGPFISAYLRPICAFIYCKLAAFLSDGVQLGNFLLSFRDTILQLSCFVRVTPGEIAVQGMMTSTLTII